MLEITGTDIQSLNDSDLRSLVGYLCEAELRSQGLSIAGVTWGGHQNATDGGIDVRVDLTTMLHNDSFVPRSKTGFQVKNSDMPRAKIIAEMKPDGMLREVIRDLAVNNGAYVIVSSQGSTSDSVLRSRRLAMQDALSDEEPSVAIKLDFYDRERIASWVRSHPSLILWIREKIGRPVQGWEPYGNWSNITREKEEEYLLDGHLRLYNSSTRHSGGLTAVNGINEIRNKLQNARSSVRLVGLSGVGKTRLLQALFDDKIGENPLNPLQAFYCDIANHPIPDPQNFATQLVAFQRNAILVVDNCPPDLHRNLTTICSRLNSSVSLITVEYDVREDQPEITEIFHLEPASTELIERVIRMRFPHIGGVGARVIAKFSGGNARIAIALGRTIDHVEDVSQLNDEALFSRLFVQRNDQDNNLLKAAEVCSLVYSFDCQTGEDDDELKLLGSLVGMNVLELYQKISELRRRELVQRRSVWGAVLPHALANRLAKRALENIPLSFMLDTFENRASERLLKSFSRRLSYLHLSKQAKEIAKIWLSEGGLLGNLSKINSFGTSLLKNIAPIVPMETLSAIERVGTEELIINGEIDQLNEISKVLYSIAYEPDLFNRAVNLLCQFALNEDSKARELLQSLFHIKLSGTHATGEQRLGVVVRLFESNQNKLIHLGLFLLSAALQVWSISSNNSFEFGARPRDYGYWPKTFDESKQWFTLFLEYAVQIAISGSPSAMDAKKLLADKFRELWVGAEMHEELSAAAIRISEKTTWNEGWIAVKATVRYDGKDMTEDVLGRLEHLDSLLVPTSLIERARLLALSRGHPYDLLDTFDDEVEPLHTAENLTRLLGKDVGSNEETLLQLLPEVLGGEGSRLYYFGQGLAEGSIAPAKLWCYFKNKLLSIEESERNYQVVRGFINVLSETNEVLCNKLLDEALLDEFWSTVFPILQISTSIGTRGARRLMESLTIGKASISQFRYLAYGRAHENINDEDLSELLLELALYNYGVWESIEILRMRLHGLAAKEVSEIIKSTGRKLISDFGFLSDGNHGHEIKYEIAEIINVCYADEAIDETKSLCIRLANALISREIYTFDFDSVFSALAKTQPFVFMDVFIRKEVIGESDWFFSRLSVREDPVDVIEDEIILQWCEIDPESRYALASLAIKPFLTDENSASIMWSNLADKFVAHAPDPVEVLKNFGDKFHPSRWSGSLSTILESRLKLIDEYKEHTNPKISQWAYQKELDLKREIQFHQEREQRRQSEENERFE
ncbi:hypothetical protein [Cohnella sp. 56]|uniref:hypothetical protein n=1 Tax=Cohnella sp. 56 TaxID=3113722 RepID=UPI0030E77CDA